MRIGIVTIHYANSYGGVLQAYATQKILSAYGETYIIDYKNPHLANTLKPIRIEPSLRSFLWAIKDLTRLLPRIRLIRKFKAFMRENYQLTNQCDNIRALESLQKKYDVLVAGSDQIWNPAVVGEADPIYFLDFANGKKKISFASSWGSYRFSPAEVEVLHNLLKSFTSISVRELDSAKFLEKLLPNRAVFDVLDPTLMLTECEWRECLNICNGSIEEDYVLVYTLKKDKLVRTILKEIVSRLSMKVVVIDQDPFLGFSSDEHFMDAGPREFVELIANAAMVVTNSFHGCSFAVNFCKPFVALKPEAGLNRIAGFLEGVGLKNRLIMNTDQFEMAINTNISYEDVQTRLADLRARTTNYLELALSE